MLRSVAVLGGYLRRRGLLALGGRLPGVAALSLADRAIDGCHAAFDALEVERHPLRLPHQGDPRLLTGRLEFVDGGVVEVTSVPKTTVGALAVVCRAGLLLSFWARM